MAINKKQFTVKGGAEILDTTSFSGGVTFDGTGKLLMNGQEITGLPTPTGNDSVATKQYVDDNSGSALFETAVPTSSDGKDGDILMYGLEAKGVSPLNQPGTWYDVAYSDHDTSKRIWVSNGTNTVYYTDNLGATWLSVTLPEPISALQNISDDDNLSVSVLCFPFTPSRNLHRLTGDTPTITTRNDWQQSDMGGIAANQPYLTSDSNNHVNLDYSNTYYWCAVVPGTRPRSYGNLALNTAGSRKNTPTGYTHQHRMYWTTPGTNAEGDSGNQVRSIHATGENNTYGYIGFAGATQATKNALTSPTAGSVWEYGVPVYSNGSPYDREFGFLVNKEGDILYINEFGDGLPANQWLGQVNGGAPIGPIKEAYVHSNTGVITIVADDVWYLEAGIDTAQGGILGTPTFHANVLAQGTFTWTKATVNGDLALPSRITGSRYDNTAIGINQTTGDILYSEDGGITWGVPSSGGSALYLKSAGEWKKLNTPDPADFVAIDGSSVMTGSLDMSGNKITNVSTPTAPADAATKEYVDGIVVESADISFTVWTEVNTFTPSSDVQAYELTFVGRHNTDDAHAFVCKGLVCVNHDDLPLSVLTTYGHTTVGDLGYEFQLIGAGAGNFVINAKTLSSTMGGNTKITITAKPL